MNQRRSFLRDVALIIAASLLPRILQPIASEIEEEIEFNRSGILWYIENQPGTVINYEIGSFRLEDYTNIIYNLKQ